jgi:hypothetical protein
MLSGNREFVTILFPVVPRPPLRYSAARPFSEEREMSNPGEFLMACNDGRVWLHCSQCNAPKRFNDVEHLDSFENPTYWGPEPWWHDTRVFRCPDCGTVQQSTLELQD